MSNSRVLLVTSGFPYGTGEQFLAAELDAWGRADGVEVTLLPLVRDDRSRPLPPGVRVDHSLAKAQASRPHQLLFATRAAVDPRYRRELADLRRRGVLDLPTARRALVAVAQALLAEEVIVGLARREEPFDLVYTYWLKPHTVGALAARDRGAVRRVVSRTHGTDLFEAARPSAYLPLARTELVRLDLLLPISQLGCRYVVERYGFDADRVQLARLGVGICPPEQMASSGATGELELVSVSSMTPLKRLDLLVAAIAEAADRMPDHRLHWRHFGDGPLRDEVERLIDELLIPRAVQVELRGHQSHDALLETLSREPADLMLNASSSEGVPVSLMETGVRGICCLATDVGATREVVPDEHSLVPSSVDSQTFGEAIVRAAENCRDEDRRQATRKVVVDRFDAARNHDDFVQRALGRVSEG